MKALVQRVSRACVRVEQLPAGTIGRGLLVLLGVTHSDTEAAADHLADKTLALRIFPDDEGRMNRSVIDIGGSLLVVSQFTLYADTRKGNRPSFVDAAPPQQAEALYARYVARLRAGLPPDRIATGVFRAHMEVELINDGPVTVELAAGSTASPLN